MGLQRDNIQMMRRIRNWMLIISLVMGALLVGTVIHDRIGKIMGRLNLVTTQMEITGWVQTGRDLVISGRITKLRDCRYEGMDSSYGYRNQLATLITVITGTPMVRDAGAFTFSGWVLKDINSINLINSYVNVNHVCYITLFGDRYDLPWVTVTRLWN